MATTITWPNTLPQQFLLDGYSETPKGNKLRTSMDAAAAKQRRMYSVKGNDVQGSMYMTEDQKVIFDDFYHTTLSDGCLEFNMPKPGYSETRIVRFPDAQPSATPAGLGWVISMQLETLP